MNIARETPTSPFNIQSRNLNSFLGTYPAKLCLYDYQVEAVAKIRDFLGDPSKPNIALCVVPTGAGKTGIGVLSAYACNATRVLVITPSQKISEQFSSNFCNGKNNFLLNRQIIQQKV